MELLIASLAWVVMGIGFIALIVALIQLTRSSSNGEPSQASAADATHPAAPCNAKHT